MSAAPKITTRNVVTIDPREFAESRYPLACWNLWVRGVLKSGGIKFHTDTIDPGRPVQCDIEAQVWIENRPDGRITVTQIIAE